MNTYLTAARARELLHYDEVTGHLTRKVSLTNSVLTGEPAGFLQKKGYVSLYVDGRRYQAHRVAWLIKTGTWPSSQIDHIDGVKNNNAFSNLREANNSENGQNKPVTSKNTSGLLGVSWMSRIQKWRAQICVNKKVIYLGAFKDKIEAQQAYLKAKRELHTHATI